MIGRILLSLAAFVLAGLVLAGFVLLVLIGSGTDTNRNQSLGIQWDL